MLLLLTLPIIMKKWLKGILATTEAATYTLGYNDRDQGLEYRFALNSEDVVVAFEIVPHLCPLHQIPMIPEKKLPLAMERKMSETSALCVVVIYIYINN